MHPRRSYLALRQLDKVLGSVANDNLFDAQRCRTNFHNVACGVESVCCKRGPRLVGLLPISHRQRRRLHEQLAARWVPVGIVAQLGHRAQTPLRVAAEAQRLAGRA